MSDSLTSNTSIPAVTLTPEQKERAYQMKTQWERPDSQLLVPLSLTQYIVHLEDRLAAPPTVTPAGWRRLIDSPYEKHSRWIYTDQPPTVEPTKWEALYARRSATKSEPQTDTLLSIKHAYLDGASAATLSGIAENALGNETTASRESGMAVSQILARCRMACGGKWPEELTSGVMFYEGERITRAEFETQAPLEEDDGACPSCGAMLGHSASCGEDGESESEISPLPENK